MDEAGRGAVIGPLVVAGVALSEDAINRLEVAGVKDSKKLTRKKREEIYGWLISEGIEHRFEIINPRRVDSYTRRRGGPGINVLEIEAILKLAAALKPDVLVVDSPTRDTEPIKETLSQNFPGIEVICQCHADENHPVVAAASIVAKVTRDGVIAEISKTLGDLGSGYPSDRKTIEVLRRLVKEGGATEEVRRSWRTIDRVMPTLSDYLSEEGGS